MKSILVKVSASIALLPVLVAVFLIFMRFSDGPKGPIAGGALKSGKLISNSNVDWKAVLGSRGGAEISFHLESTQRSRTTGSIVHDNQLYIPCDLGFMWKRFSGSTRAILQVMSTLKTWHEEAMQNGSVVIRIEDKLYERNLVRVYDPSLLAELRHITERQVDESYMGPLPDIAGDPEEIWYFLVQPR